MAWKVQIAFQGGGARFIQHLAVAHAFQSLEAERIVEVTRVAGTSAGSLAAAIVASGISAETAAEQLRVHMQAFVRQLRTPSLPIAACKLCSGASMVDSRNLEKVFSSVWKTLFPSDTPRYIKQLQKPLFVVATDIVSRAPVTFGDSDKDQLIEL